MQAIILPFLYKWYRRRTKSLMKGNFFIEIINLEYLHVVSPYEEWLWH